MPTLEERVAALEAKLDQLAKDQQATDSDMGKIPEGLMLAIRVSARGTNARITDLDQKVQTLDRKVDGMDARLESLADDMAAVLSILGGKPRPPKPAA